MNTRYKFSCSETNHRIPVSVFLETVGRRKNGFPLMTKTKSLVLCH